MFIFPVYFQEFCCITKHKKVYKFHFHWQWSRRSSDCGKIHFGKSNKITFCLQIHCTKQTFTGEEVQIPYIFVKIKTKSYYTMMVPKNGKKHFMAQTLLDPLPIMQYFPCTYFNPNFEWIEME